MGWLIFLGIVFLIAITPVGVQVAYNSEGILLRVIAGLLRITILPQKKKKEKKPKEPKQKKEKKTKPASKKTPPAEKPKEKGGSVLDFLPLVQVALDFLGDFRRKLRVNRLEMKLIMAGGDPCDLAVNYGKAWAALGNLMPLLERAFVIKKRDLEVECDFTESKTLVIARLDLTITIGRILSLAVRYAIRALIEFLKITNKRKGGAVK